MSRQSIGRDHLETRSRLILRLATLPAVASILVIDDALTDGGRLAANLRLLFGHAVRIRQIRQLREIRAALRAEMPDLLFLDDRLGPGSGAEASLAQISAAGCQRRVIIFSGLLTRARRIELLRLGVADVVHKDDIDAARLSEAILKAFDDRPPRPGSLSP